MLPVSLKPATATRHLVASFEVWIQTLVHTANALRPSRPSDPRASSPLSPAHLLSSSTTSTLLLLQGLLPRLLHPRRPSTQRVTVQKSHLFQLHTLTFSNKHTEDVTSAELETFISGKTLELHISRVRPRLFKGISQSRGGF